MAALVALYQTAGGDAWKSNGNWLSEAHIGEWHGVTTDSGGFVTRLDLRSNRLSGEIPPELGSIPYLQSLDLSGNELSGEIPSELDSLANLVTLDLNGNRLSGEISLELGNLYNLATLDISGNDFDGEMPSELGSLSNLARLYLGGSNQLEDCVPRGLQDVPEGDVDSIGLPFCQVAATSDLDRVALVALYESTEGESWAMNANWLSDAPIGEWHGVTVDHSGARHRVGSQEEPVERRSPQSLAVSPTWNGCTRMETN